MLLRHELTASATGLGAGGACGFATIEVHALLPEAADGAGEAFGDRPGTGLAGTGARKSANLPKLRDEDDEAGVDAIVDDNSGEGMRESMRLISSTLRLGS